MCWTRTTTSIEGRQRGEATELVNILSGDSAEIKVVKGLGNLQWEAAGAEQEIHCGTLPLFQEIVKYLCHGKGFSIQDTCIAAQERGARFPALCGVLSVLKAVLLHPAQSGAGNPGTALQLCKIDLLQRELVSLLGHHLLNGLCHNRGHGCEIGLFHLISFHRGLATPPV